MHLTNKSRSAVLRRHILSHTSPVPQAGTHNTFATEALILELLIGSSVVSLYHSSISTSHCDGVIATVITTDSAAATCSKL